MTIKRITISVSDEIADRIKRAAKGVPVSTWVTDRIEEHLDEEALRQQWEEFYRDVNPTRADRRRAELLFRRLTSAKQRRRDAA